MGDTPMTKTERESLIKLVNRREKVAKAEIEQHKLKLLADVEAQLAAKYKADCEAWADVTRD